MSLIVIRWKRTAWRVILLALVILLLVLTYEDRVRFVYQGY